tara:strand:- start:402 stop:578 length:177 start_codon:yes stop_codon:yes gene_type:complete
MNISNAKYLKDRRDNNVAVLCTINGQESYQVPLDTANTHYAEILKQVADGTITIAEAD